ncbi:MAG: hypothetical protein ACLU8W_05785 [Clostridia bacterium]
MTLKRAAEILEQLDPSIAPILTVGHIDGNLEKAVGVYPDKNAPKERQACIGGEEATLSHCTWLTLLVHWTRSPVEAEKKARELFEALCHAAPEGVSYLDVSEPVDVYKDSRGIFEYVINFKVYECKEDESWQ